MEPDKAQITQQQNKKESKLVEIEQLANQQVESPVLQQKLIQQQVKPKKQDASTDHTNLKIQEQHQMQEKVDSKKLLQQLMEFGFDQKLIMIALQYTNNKQKAAQIALKLSEQGLNADLSEYIQKKKIEKVQEGKKKQKQKPNRPKMLFIVNGSLKMGKGKICAQVGHAAIGAYLQAEQLANFDQKTKMTLKAWEFNGGAKIVVRAQTQEQMTKIKKQLDELKINTYLVEDAGHTQIKAGSKTILGIGPAFSNELDPYTKHLKLL